MTQLETATLTALFVEGILYGLYVLLFCASIAVLLVKRKRERRFNVALFTVSVLMFLLSTIHIITNFCHALQGFVTHHDDPQSYFQEMVRTSYFVIKNITYVVQTLVGDGFMIYRLYLIWGGNKYICAPVVASFASCWVTAIGGLVLTQQSGPRDSLFAANLRTWLIAFLSATLVTDLSCTILIVVRIWSVHSAVRDINMAGPSMMPAIAAVVESGAIYSLWVAVVLALFVSDNIWYRIAMIGLVQLIGIVFSIIIVRVGLRISVEYVDQSSSEPQLGTLLFNDANPRNTRSQGQVRYSSEPTGIPLRTRREVSTCNQFELERIKLQEGRIDSIGSRSSNTGRKRPSIELIEDYGQVDPTSLGR
jgi:hypothetical protein